ncbi:MAG TPA: DUF4386 family protein [Nocardioides sp.]|nr:DUF4386 family protein [Nocardioides sp.]
MSDSTLSTTTSTSSVSDWATEIAGQAEAPSKHRPRRGLAAMGAAMVGGPLAMTAWFLVEPSVLPREDADVFLASVATSPDRYLIGTVFMAMAAALTVLSAFGFARLLGDRLPRLGLVVGVLMFLSGIGLAAQVGFRAVVWSLVGEGTVPASSVESFHAFQTGGLFDILVAPGLVFGGLATLLTVGALLRTRLVSWWVPVAMLAGMVLASGEFPDPVTVGGAALGAAANLVLARTLLARG